MSQALPPGPPTAPPAPAPGPPRPPIVRLKTWVNVVLVLILLASCSGASNVSDLVVQTGDGSGVASQAEVTDMCRLLGAVAAKQDIDLATVFPESGTTTQCQDAARAPSAP
jgi:hypothetical protein